MIRKYQIGYLSATMDILHIGHVSAILKAKKYCDNLIIGLLSDKTIEKYKGVAPIISYSEREMMLILLTISFKVVKQNDINPYNNLVKYKVDVIFSGDGFEEEEKNAIKKAGCKLIEFDYYSRQSTTKIKEKIIEQYREK